MQTRPQRSRYRDAACVRRARACQPAVEPAQQSLEPLPSGSTMADLRCPTSRGNQRAVSGWRPDVGAARHHDAQLMATQPPDTATNGLGRARFARACGLLAFVTFNAGWVAADLAQPQAFSPARDDLSDLGALTASTLALQPACCQPLRLVGNRARNR